MISERDLLALVEPLAFLAAFAYLMFLVVRWTAILVNGRRPAETDEDWREWMERDTARRCDARQSDASDTPPPTNLAGWQTHIWRVDPGIWEAVPRDGDTLALSPVDDGETSGSVQVVGRPSSTHAYVRPRYPMARVTVGWYAGARVRVLACCHAEPGSWFVEVVEGAGEVRRGDRTVVRGDWLA